MVRIGTTFLAMCALAFVGTKANAGILDFSTPAAVLATGDTVKPGLQLAHCGRPHRGHVGHGYGGYGPGYGPGWHRSRYRAAYRGYGGYGYGGFGPPTRPVYGGGYGYGAPSCGYGGYGYARPRGGLYIGF